MLLNLNDCVFLTTQVFFIGLAGLISSQNNVIFTLISIEMLLLAASLNFIFCSALMGDIHGQIFSLFILTIAAAESAIGLAIVVAFYRLRGSTNLEAINLLKG